MDKRVLLVLVIVIILVAAVGGAFLYFSRSATPVATPTPVPVATPAVTSQSGPALTASSQTSLVAGQPGSVDVFIDTKSVKVDGFQFIATLAGNSLPTVPDSDSATDGIQIQAATLPELSVSTNSVTEQDGTFIIRFAMIATDSTAGFSTSGPTKIASIPVSTGTGGKVTLTFNQQNSRVRLTSGGDDTLMSVTDASLTVAASTATSATGSGTLVNSTPATSSATTTTAAATSPFCLASCFTDSDCAAGFVCETDRCVNPACPTSQTCGCGATAGATPVATTRASALPTAVPVSTVAPLSTIAPTIAPSTVAVATSSGELPSSGSFEYTLLTIGAGLLLVGGGVFLTAKQEA